MIEEIHKKWLEELPAPNGMLKNIQYEARKLLISLGIPKNSQEEWRLTNIKKIKAFISLPLAKEEEIEKKLSKHWPETPKNSSRIILNHKSIKNIVLPKGVQLLSEKELQEKLEETKQTESNPNNWTQIINQACTNDILALKINSEETVSLEILMPTEESALSSTRILIILDQKAKLNLLQIALGSKNSATNNLIEVYLNDSAEMDHGFIGLGKGEANLITQICIKQEERSIYSLNSIQNGWQISRIEPRVIQKKGQASTTLKGLQVSSGNQQLATHSFVRFEGPEGSLNQLQKSVATKQSHCIFNGAINVPQIAQRTNASQLSRNLLISNEAKIDTKPELEIIADDVKCAHGATVSQLQEDELFYLRSRGINNEQATSLLLQGYCQEILDKLPVAANRWNILEEIIKDIKQ